LLLIPCCWHWVRGARHTAAAARAVLYCAVHLLCRGLAAAAVGAELCKGEVACIIKQAYCVFPTKVTVLLLLQR
jgi:hypothetical protein